MKKFNKPTILALAAIAVGAAALFGFAENPLEMLARLSEMVDASQVQ